MIKKYLDQGMDVKYATYHAMVESMDNSVGRVLKAIHKKGIEDNTIIFLISDQGSLFTNEPLRGGKQAGFALYEGGSKIPFIVKIPQVKHRKVEERINTLNVFPTLVDLAGGNISQYAQLDGVSLKKTLYGGKCPEIPLYFYRSYDDQGSSIIYKDYKLIYSRSEKHELYNLNKDAYESTNLINLQSEKYIQMELKEMMEEFLSKYEVRSVPYPKNQIESL